MNTPSSDDKLWAGLGYAGLILCMIPSLVIFLLKKDESDYIKFNTLQALFFGLIWLVLGFGLNIVAGIIAQIPVVGLMFMLVPMVVGLAFLGYWVYLMVQAFTGKDVRIPMLSDWVAQNFMGS